ncbi:MAG: CopD family protein [Myxococcales bacterium]|nr:MAG: CopD family protein [Myxococcales bacterium]
MDLRTLALSIHLYSVMIWFGGSLMASWIAVFFTQSDFAESRAEFYNLIRRAMRSVVTPFLILAWLTGLYILLTAWASTYAKMPWMHTKLTLACLLTGLTGYISATIKKASQGQDKQTAIRISTTVLSLLAALIIALVRFKPF